MEKTVWIKATGGKTVIIVTEENPMPDSVTEQECPGQFYEWTETGWQFSQEKWLNEVIRPERNKLLDAADARVRRYDYQLRAGITPKESESVIALVLTYMQELRDLPGNAEYASFAWPLEP